MSHTFRAEDGTVFISNSDLSGGVEIRATPCYDGDGHSYVTVSGEALLSFVANHIRNERIAKLERMTDEEILES